jgi:hypothetical protein
MRSTTRSAAANPSKPRTSAGKEDWPAAVGLERVQPTLGADIDRHGFDHGGLTGLPARQGPRVSGAGGCLHTALYARSGSGKRGRWRVGPDRCATTAVINTPSVRRRDQTPGSLPSGSRTRRSRASMRRNRSISASALRSRSCSSTRAARQRWSVPLQSSSMRRESSCASRDRRLSHSIASPAPVIYTVPSTRRRLRLVNDARAAVCNQTHARPLPSVVGIGACASREPLDHPPLQVGHPLPDAYR